MNEVQVWGTAAIVLLLAVSHRLYVMSQERRAQKVLKRRLKSLPEEEDLLKRKIEIEAERIANVIRRYEAIERKGRAINDRDLEWWAGRKKYSIADEYSKFVQAAFMLYRIRIQPYTYFSQKYHSRKVG